MLSRAPARHRVDDITIRVRRLRGLNEGKVSLTPADTPWVTLVARNPSQLARELERCYAEVECAGYARWKRQRPEGAELGSVDDDPLAAPPKFSDITPPTARQAKGWRTEEWRSGGNKREQHPADWTPLPDGRWESPKGRVFNPGTEMAQRVIRRRIALGLPITAVDGKYDLGAVAEQIEKAAADAGVSAYDWLVQLVEAAANADATACQDRVVNS